MQLSEHYKENKIIVLTFPLSCSHW